MLKWKHEIRTRNVRSRVWTGIDIDPEPALQVQHFAADWNSVQLASASGFALGKPPPAMAAPIARMLSHDSNRLVGSSWSRRFLTSVAAPDCPALESFTPGAQASEKPERMARHSRPCRAIVL